jgi:hypothetical protein
LLRALCHIIRVFLRTKQLIVCFRPQTGAPVRTITLSSFFFRNPDDAGFRTFMINDHDKMDAGCTISREPFRIRGRYLQLFHFSFYRSVIVPQNPPDKTVNAKKSIPMH